MGFDPVRSQSIKEPRLIEAEVLPQVISEDRDESDEEREAGRGPCQPPDRPMAARRLGLQPQRSRDQHERDRGQRAHGCPSRQDAPQNWEIKLPAQQDGTADDQGETAGGT